MNFGLRSAPSLPQITKDSALDSSDSIHSVPLMFQFEFHQARPALLATARELITSPASLANSLVTRFECR